MEMISKAFRDKIIKVIAVFMLTVILLLVFSFQNLSQFKIVENLLPQYTQSSTLDGIQKCKKKLNDAITQLKLKTNSVERAKQCPRFVKLDEVGVKIQQLQKLEMSQEICSKRIQRKSQIILITVIIPGHLNIKTIQNSAYKLQQDILKYAGIEVKIQIKGDDKSILPQQLRDKIDNEDYISFIAAQSKELNYLRYCRFSNKKCQNFILFLRQWQTLNDNYYQVGNIYFSKPNHYLQTIISIVFGPITSVKVWNNLAKIIALQNMLNELNFMSHLVVNKMNKLNDKYAQQYIKQTEAYLRQNGSIPSSPFQDIASIKIDMFPSEYKLGIYLPILLILVVFPCTNVLKI